MNSGWVIFAATLAVSAIVHAWAVASLLQSRPGDLGSTDVATAAISINLETTDVIDAMESAAAKEAASSPAGAPVEAAMETKEKIEDAKDDKATPPAETAPEKLLTKERARLAVEAEAERQRAADEAALEKKINEEAELDETKRRAEEAAKKLAEIEEVEKKKHEKTQQAALPGGAGTTGSADAKQSDGRVSASQGSILNYGASLRAYISSNTPRNIRKTSIWLAFSVAPSGGLTTLDVLKSSNSPEVDRRMLDLMRNLASHFPPPPPGASPQQLSYNIEIIFH